MSSNKKEYELFLELLLLAERYSLNEIRELKVKLWNFTSDQKITEMFEIIINLKEGRIKKPLSKRTSSSSAKYESMVLTELGRSEPEKYAILKPIEVALIEDKDRIKTANIKELVLELGGSKKDVKSRKNAIRVLMKMLSKMTKEEIEKYGKTLSLERKEGRLDELANLIMGDSNAKIQ